MESRDEGPSKNLGQENSQHFIKKKKTVGNNYTLQLFIWVPQRAIKNISDHQPQICYLWQLKNIIVEFQGHGAKRTSPHCLEKDLQSKEN